MAIGFVNKHAGAAYEKPGFRFALLLSTIMGLLILGTTPIPAQAAADPAVASPPPSAVGEDVTYMDDAFKMPPEYGRPFEIVKETLKEAPPFFRDTKLDLNLRSFYLYREKFDKSKLEAWTLGGSLSYKSGFLWDHFAIGAALYTSQPIYAPGGRDGTLLLKPSQEEYTVLGQLYGQIKIMDDIFINLYRKEMNTPYINKNDNRMTPNTFEAYTLEGKIGGKNGSPEFRFGGGYVDRIKQRNDDDFIPMSQAAGVDEHRGVMLAGANYSAKDFSIGAINYYSEDILNIFYTEGKYSLPLAEGLGALFTAQFTEQRSTGDDLITGDDFSTNQLGLKAEASYGGGLLALAYTHTAEGENMRNPWSGYPGYTSVQVQDFNRAGEEAIMIKAAYDFSGLGLKDVTAYALWVHGWGAIDPVTEASVYDQDEYNFDLQWRPKSAWLKGFWPRFRYAHVDQSGGEDSHIDDFRIILNYDFSLL